jgi:hypothetical protein
MPSVDIGSLPGLAILENDEASHSATVRVEARSWTTSETARAQSLHSANEARLAGWMLRRVTA